MCVTSSSSFTALPHHHPLPLSSSKRYGRKQSPLACLLIKFHKGHFEFARLCVEKEGTHRNIPCLMCVIILSSFSLFLVYSLW